MNFRSMGIVLLVLVFVLGMTRSLLDINIPYALTLSMGLSGLVALGIDSYQRDRLKKFAFRVSVFVLVLVLIAAVQYFVGS
jgi:hypothetical protein